jgi:hypothetical protein
MWQNLKTFGKQDNGFADTGIGKIAKQNRVHRLRHGHYLINL